MPAQDGARRHTGIGAAGAADGLDAKVRIGEQCIDRRGERVHTMSLAFATSTMRRANRTASPSA